MNAIVLAQSSRCPIVVFIFFWIVIALSLLAVIVPFPEPYRGWTGRGVIVLLLVLLAIVGIYALGNPLTADR